MKCRKCGAEIPDNSLRCPNCAIKVNVRCPECKTLVPFGEKYCSECGFELIKNCSKCGASNVYSAKECRKCHNPFPTLNEDSDKILLNKVEKSKNNTAEQNLNTEFSPALEFEKAPNKEHFDYEQDMVSELSEPEIANEGEAIDETLPEPDVSVLKDIINNDNSETFDDLLNETENADNLPEINDNLYDESELPEINDDNVDLTEITRDENEAQAEDTLLSRNDEKSDLTEFNEKQEYLSDIDEIEPAELVEEEPVIQEKIEEPKKKNKEIIIQKNAVNTILELIKTSIDRHVIAVNGVEGSGKTAVLKQVENNLDDEAYIFLYGSCTPLIQITSFGFFQDAFLRILGFPPFTKSAENFVKEFRSSKYSELFNFLSPQEITLFLNIFYPHLTDEFEKIEVNRDEVFKILEKVIKSFSVNTNLIIAIDNFELLDGASYDFIVNILKKGFFTNRIKLIVTYKENKAIQSYFDLTNVSDNIFESIKLKHLEEDEIVKTTERTLNINVEKIFSSDFIKEILSRCEGNSLRFEQEIALLFDIGYISSNENEILINEDKKLQNPPNSFEELIKMRLNMIVPAAKNVLFMAAIMGYRFSTDILCNSVATEVDKTEGIINYLSDQAFIKKVDNYTYEFKSLTIWKLIYQEAKNDILYKENTEKLYANLKNLVLSSNLQKLISCNEALTKEEEYNIWQDTSKLCAKLGDTNLYVISQKQCLMILDSQEIENSDEIKLNIYEQIGKVLSEKSPKEAITYLSTVLDSEIKANNINKIIDISGYFINSCYLSGNYFGTVEAVDAVLKAIEDTNVTVSTVDIALIKSRKLKALTNIGNSEQIINLVNEEIIRNLEKALASEKMANKYKILLIDGWLSSKTALAKAYALQGNPEVFNVIESMNNFIFQNDYKNNYYKIQIRLLEAFADTIFGNVTKSNETLGFIISITKNKPMDTELLSEWNLINVINRVMSGEKDGLKSDLFELAIFTNNINQHFVKNIIKLILGYVLKEDGNTKKALEIFNEQITYFAKEKVAIGAMLSWLLIIQIAISMGDNEKALNTAMKSLEIAESPKINNYIFTIYFNKYISEIYLKKGDLTAAKMYLEKAILSARENKLKYQLVDLYLSYSAYIQEVMRLSKNYNSANLGMINDTYNKAIEIANELQLKNLINKAIKEKNEFKTFCQLNSIN